MDNLGSVNDMLARRGSLNRRTLVKGAAWAIPVMAISVAAPARASSTAIPDLSISLTFPDPNFPAGNSKPRTFLVNLSEINGVSTTTGTIVFTIPKIAGWRFLPYDATLTSATPSGGAVQVVNNPQFREVSENTGFVTFQANPDTGISANGSVSIALQIQKIPGTAINTSQNLSAVISSDPTFGYDSDQANNNATIQIHVV